MAINIGIVISLAVLQLHVLLPFVAGQCDVDQLYTEDNGIISSHKRYGRLAYDGELDCLYVIKAYLPSYKIEVTTMTFDLEYTDNCAADSVQVYAGSGTTYPLLGKFCGTKTWTLTADSNFVTIKFTTDKYLNKGGFQIRYKFITKDQAQSRFNCPTNFLPCGDGKSCFFKDWKCDGIKDCGNNFDETNCEVSTSSLTCSSSQKPCKDGSKCIISTWWCDKVKDCLDNSDESDCSVTAVTTPSPVLPPVTTAGSGVIITPTGSCGSTPIQPDETRIVGGKEAIPHSWPWMCSLRLGGGHYCGGSIYNSQWIVTAAHCVDSHMYSSEWIVECGRHNRDGSQSGVQIVGVDKVIRHTGYEASKVNKDIALMKLKTPLIFNNMVQPVCLGTVNPSAGTFCFTTGWGNTQNTGDASVLRQISVPIVSNTICNDNSHYAGAITDYMICAGYEQGGKDACQGDSGGPLVCRSSPTSPWYLQGITSFGEGCAKAQRPGIYTRVTQFVTWISEQVAKN